MLQSWIGNSRPQQFVHATRMQGVVETLQRRFWDEGFRAFVYGLGCVVPSAQMQGLGSE